MRLLIVQYGGDYRETFHRLRESGVETYHAQKYAVSSVIDISEHIEEATFLCCQTKEYYNELLQDRLRAIGAALNPYQQTGDLLKLISEQRPTHLVVHSPIPGIFRWAIQNKIPTLALLADSFLTNGLNHKFKNYLLARLLNDSQIGWVANHGINSCRSLQTIGVNSDKIIPWDWPHFITPSSFPPKKLSENQGKYNLLCVGAVTKSKGIGDVIDGIKNLRSKKLPVSLQIAGSGEISYFAQQARTLNIENYVNFLGLVPHNEIFELMRRSDIVLVPSRYEYPEGLPLTIYEAFCSRTPLVASDHPMFQYNLQHGVNAMIFPAGNSTRLAECVEKLVYNPELYKTISQASEAAWKQLQIPVKWAELIKRWLNNSPENQNWISQHRLNSGIYNSRYK